MDRARFDALARLLATSGSRRGALGALLGVALLGQNPEALAKRRKRKDRDRDHGAGQDRDRGHAGGRGQRHDRLAAEARGKRKNRKTRKRRQQRGDRDADGGGSSAGNCCGAKRCSPPESGSTRSQCDYAGRSFAGQDLNGSTFRGIDGRGATFDDTDNSGSVFAEACLQGATFRGANLEGSTWGDACLLDADFTGADLGGDSATFGDAIRCRTTLPDGRRDDRDCGAARPCCREQLGAGEACVVAGDCQNEPCQTKACVDGACVYTAVANGPSPNARCASRCCSGTCCPPDATACNLDDQCCVPNCAGRRCGPDGCGRGGECGECPAGQVCEEDSGQCRCQAESCQNGCCAADGRCQPGDSNQFCGSGGEPCAACTGQDRCRDGTCTCVADCQGKTCGPDGCGGSCGACPPHASCNGAGTACTCDVVRCDGACCAPDQVCDRSVIPNACCTPEAPATTCAGAKCGRVTNTCGQVVNCGGCPPATEVCQTAICSDIDHLCHAITEHDGSRCTTAGGEGICCGGLCVAGDCCAHADCGGNSNICTDHVCTCGAGPACRAPDLVCCGARPEGTCADLLTDPMHCGTCDRECTGGDTCQVPTCTDGLFCGTEPAPDNTNPGGLCPGSQVCCSSICTSIDNLANCGRCGNRCPIPSTPCFTASCDGRSCGSEIVPDGRSGPGCADGECCNGVCCTDPTPFCNLHTGQCIACTEDSHCLSGQVCCGGQCFEGCCPLLSSCAHDDQCCRGICGRGTGGDPAVCCLFLLQECTSNSECCDNCCTPGGGSSLVCDPGGPCLPD